ncbi:MAG: membrane protein insertase YidC [Bacteroidaceae bacterium]|nr:membrane protein insertase YidC [Bacteroidaceae bacterium]
MDKRTYYGFLLIGLAIILMFFLNKPNKEQAAKQQQYAARQDSIRMAEFENDTTAVIEADTMNVTNAVDTLSPFFPSLTGTDEIYTISNSHVKVGISSKGGIPCRVELNDYKNQQGGNVIIFDQSEISLNIRIDGKDRNISTGDLYFIPTDVTGRSITMRMLTQGYGSLDFHYELDPESYMVNLDIRANGMSDLLPSNLSNLSVEWIQNLRQQEKGFEFEQRYTTLTYKRGDKNNAKKLMVSGNPRIINSEEPLEWVAFKNQFFSTILISSAGFDANARLAAASYQKGNGYLKKMSATLVTAFDPRGNEPTRLQFYLGPNDYKILRSANSLVHEGSRIRLQKVMDLGWPIVREFNRFLIIPLFNLLSRWGLNMGIVILLLTVIIKAIVQPFTYKSFISSAKMRALKPYVDEVNAMYPKPEDAMKKQQETMAVYSKYGVSPMGGCLPTLIQTPIWMAFFFFVPNAIELRQQSFLWAADLTGFDDIIHWSSNIPLIGNHLSIFCLLFCASNVINTVISMKQQQQAPGQEDAMKTMKWMMYLMPVIFFFSFNNYSSGLCYYYFISALANIIIMMYLRRTTNEAELLKQLQANYEANRNDPKKSRSNSMMARLEAMQKEQERLRQLQNKQKGK